MASLNEELIELFRCPGCSLYMHPPIHYCVRGDNFCEQCFAKSVFCPACDRFKTDERSLLLERIHDNLMFPCKKQEWDCKVVCTGSCIKEHEQTCLKDWSECPLDKLGNCGWSGTEEQFTQEHWKQQHPEVSFVQDGKLLAWRNFKNENVINNKVTIALFAMGELFACIWEVNLSTGTVSWIVHFMGDPSVAEHYRYEILFSCDSRVNVKLNGMCAPIINGDLSFKDGYARKTDYRTCKYFCSGDDLIYRVKVKKVAYS